MSIDKRLRALESNTPGIGRAKLPRFINIIGEKDGRRYMVERWVLKPHEGFKTDVLRSKRFLDPEPIAQDAPEFRCDPLRAALQLSEDAYESYESTDSS